MREIIISFESQAAAILTLMLAALATVFAILFALQMELSVRLIDRLNSGIEQQNAEIAAASQAMQARLNALFVPKKSKTDLLTTGDQSSKKANEPQVALLLPGQIAPKKRSEKLAASASKIIPVEAAEWQEIETKLKKDGFFDGSPDGFADREAILAISAFQKKHNLKNQNGNLDTATLINLGFSWIIDRAEIQ